MRRIVGAISCLCLGKHLYLFWFNIFAGINANMPLVMNFLARPLMDSELSMVWSVR